MGKASSSKKVARAAKAGGSLRERPKLGFPLGLFVIVVLGTALVTFARTDRLDSLSSLEAPVKNKDHWHAAFGVYVCDTFLPASSDVPGKADTDGIHTHGDGIAHIHPYSAKGSGTNAKLKVFGEMIGLEFTSDSFTFGGTTYSNGFMCGDKPAKVMLYRWSDAFDESVPAEVFTTDIGEVRFRDDRSAFTLAVVPEGTEVPRPESVATLDNLSDVPGSAASGAQGGDPTQGLDPTQIDPSTLTVPPGGETSPAVSTPADPNTPVTDAPVTSDPVTSDPVTSDPAAVPEPTPSAPVSTP